MDLLNFTLFLILLGFYAFAIVVLLQASILGKHLDHEYRFQSLGNTLLALNFLVAVKYYVVSLIQCFVTEGSLTLCAKKLACFKQV